MKAESLVRHLVLALFGVAVLSVCQDAGDTSRQQAPADTVPAAGDTTAAAAPATPAPAAADDEFNVDPNNVQAALRWDSVTKTVTYPIIAGLTSTNNAWNFNGYANGGMTIAVPLNAKVAMPFTNLDANVPHSFGIVAGDERSIPAAPGDPIFPGAATSRFETGIRTGQEEVVRFTADKAGRYLFVCGVPGHPTGGMWVWFEVSRTATRPEVRTR